MRETGMKLDLGTYASNGRKAYLDLDIVMRSNPGLVDRVRTGVFKPSEVWSQVQ